MLCALWNRGQLLWACWMWLCWIVRSIIIGVVLIRIMVGCVLAENSCPVCSFAFFCDMFDVFRTNV